MKHVGEPNDLSVLQTRRSKFLAERPTPGERMCHKGEPVTVVDIDDFNFEVKYQSLGGGIQSAPFEEFTRKG